METEANSSSSIKGVIGAHSSNACKDGSSAVNDYTLSKGDKFCRIPHQTAVKPLIVIIRDEKAKVPLGPFRPQPSPSTDNNNSSINRSRLGLNDNFSGSINRRPTNSPSSNS